MMMLWLFFSTLFFLPFFLLGGLGGWGIEIFGVGVGRVVLLCLTLQLPLLVKTRCSTRGSRGPTWPHFHYHYPHTHSPQSVSLSLADALCSYGFKTRSSLSNAPRQEYVSPLLPTPYFHPHTPYPISLST